jgi:hypothetical protein
MSPDSWLNFHEKFENVFKVKCYGASKESNLHITNATFNPRKLPNK